MYPILCDGIIEEIVKTNPINNIEILLKLKIPL